MAMASDARETAVNILCKFGFSHIRESEGVAFAVATQDIEAMPRPTPDEIAIAIADSLPCDADRRDEIIAVGMVATALISGSDDDARPDLIEEFCAILRKSVAGELN